MVRRNKDSLPEILDYASTFFNDVFESVLALIQDLARVSLGDGARYPCRGFVKALDATVELLRLIGYQTLDYTLKTLAKGVYSGCMAFSQDLKVLGYDQQSHNESVMPEFGSADLGGGGGGVPSSLSLIHI